MAENSKIEWTDHTFNPWWGCTPVSSACDFCYAEALSKRFGKDLWGNKPRMRTSASNWHQPLKWNKKAAGLGIRYRVFCASMADVFDNQVPEEWRRDMWELIRKTPHLDWLLLTKRPQNIKDMLPVTWGDGYHNVWLGMTAENQQELDRRLHHLLDVPAVVHFLSCEPLLSALNLTRVSFANYSGENRHKFNALTGKVLCYAISTDGQSEYIVELDNPVMRTVSWVIVGGESGAHARPMHPDWARSLRGQCEKAGVPFLFKQWGEWKHGSDFAKDAKVILNDGTLCDGDYISLMAEDRNSAVMARHPEMIRKVGKKEAGRELDGRTWDEFPKVAA